MRGVMFSFAMRRRHVRCFSPSMPSRRLPLAGRMSLHLPSPSIPYQKIKGSSLQCRRPLNVSYFSSICPHQSPNPLPQPGRDTPIPAVGSYSANSIVQLNLNTPSPILKHLGQPPSRRPPVTTILQDRLPLLPFWASKSGVRKPACYPRCRAYSSFSSGVLGKGHIGRGKFSY